MTREVLEHTRVAPALERGAIRLTTGQAIVRFLKTQYSLRDGHRRRLVPAMFGIFGHGNLAGLGHALQQQGQELPYYRPCNEQNMVHTAAAFAKASRRTATLACTSSIGPGATNMITGAALATINRLPVLLLPSDYYASRRQGPVLQQLEHQISIDASVNDCFRPVSRFFDRIIRPAQLVESLIEAMRVLTDPIETGAVTIALPQDVQAEATDFPAELFVPRVWRIERPAPSAERIHDAVRLIGRARRPFAIAGGGVIYSGASAELEALCEQLRIPVGETAAGKGAVRGEASMLVGGCGVSGTGTAAALMRESDLVLCVGTRLTDFTTGSRSAFQNPDVQFISINIDRRDANKLSALPIVADAREALRALAACAAEATINRFDEQVTALGHARTAWLRALNEDRARPSKQMTQHDVIHVLNEQMIAGDVVIAAAGTGPGDLLRLFDTSGGRECHLEYGYSCMGYELPAAIGVRLAKQEAGEVYAFVGDGTYLLSPSELVTAVQEELKIAVIICENHGYQSIHGLQKDLTSESFGNEFRYRGAGSNGYRGEYVGYDLAMSARGLGAHAWRVESTDALVSALEAARSTNGPSVIVAEVSPHRLVPRADVWWDVSPPQVGETETQTRVRETYEETRDSIQRRFLTPSSSAVGEAEGG